MFRLFHLFRHTSSALDDSVLHRIPLTLYSYYHEIKMIYAGLSEINTCCIRFSNSLLSTDIIHHVI